MSLRVDVLGDTAGEDHAVHALHLDRFGEEQRARGRFAAHRRDDQIRHGRCDPVEVGRPHLAAEIEVEADGRGVLATAGFDARHGVAIHGDQSPTDVQRRGGEHPTAIDDCQLGCPATDIDVEDAVARLV